MPYITLRQSPRYHQMTLDEFLFSPSPQPYLLTANETNTRTYLADRVPDKLQTIFRPQYAIGLLNEFNATTKRLRSVPRKSLYREFYIPKKSGGFRRIDAPNAELMDALRRLKTLFETEFHALYHTSAFAYIPGRSAIDAVKRHQQNESRWFAKFDLSDFFGSTTPAFVLTSLSRVFPFSEIVKTDSGLNALQTALDLGFLDGGLPQGTPLSPMLTNLIMIPIDYALYNTFRQDHFVYTRYADDFIISSRRAFDVHKAEEHINEAMRLFGAPYRIKAEKTRYGSSAGSNWNLGVMLNKDNQITIGAKKKRQFKAMLTSYVLDRKNGRPWEISDVRVLDGFWHYYHMVEGKPIDDIVSAIGRKFHADIPALLHADLRTPAS